MDTFYHFESSIYFASIYFVNFSMKTRSTEKMEYTTTKHTENSSKLTSQFFYFWNFVTEIFCHKVILKIIISSIENCTNFLIKYGFLHNFVAKNLCDKVSKIKTLILQFRSIFRWLCRGVFNFFCRPCFHGEICKTKWSL